MSTVNRSEKPGEESGQWVDDYLEETRDQTPVQTTSVPQREAALPESFGIISPRTRPQITLGWAVTLAVIPFGSTLGNPDNKMVIADLNVGILYTFGIVSLGVYGIVLAG